jgi:hypothetical protein
MSTHQIVTIQVGQCGNQVGYELYGNLMREILSKDASPQFKQIATETFFRQDAKGKKKLKQG